MMTKIQKAMDDAVANIVGIDGKSGSHAVERASIEAAMADRKTATKLLNWPPSRGPMPARLRRPMPMHPATISVREMPEGSAPLVRRSDVCRELRCDVHVETLLGLTLEQATNVVFVVEPDGCCQSYIDAVDLSSRKRRPIKAGKVYRRRKRNPPTLVADIDYPVSRAARVTVPPYRRNGPTQSWGHFLWQVARAYQEVYRQWKRYGVWGHALGDLCFEGIAVTKDGRVVLHIGS
jgi:hypothetical protein